MCFRSDFGKELNLDTLQRKRFVKAVNDLRVNYNAQYYGKNGQPPKNVENVGNNNGHNNNNNNNNNNEPQIVVSSQEHNALSRLESRLNDTNKTLATISQSFDSLDVSSINSQTEINETIKLFVSKLEKKRNELLSECEAMRLNKIELLKQQMTILNQHKKNISQAKTKYEELMSNKGIDKYDRQMNVLSMVDQVLNQNVNLSLITQPTMKFLENPKIVSKLFNSLQIDDCDTPSQPIVIIKDSKFSSIHINWTTEYDDELKSFWKENYEMNKNNSTSRLPSEFEIQYFKYGKYDTQDKRNRKDLKHKRSKKDKNKNKNKSNKNKTKKSKKKKRKRKNKYDSDSDSSSSDSSDSSSSESDSDSDSDSSSSGSGDDEPRMAARARAQAQARVAAAMMPAVNYRVMDDEKRAENEMGSGNDDNSNKDSIEKKIENLDLSSLHWKKIVVSSKYLNYHLKHLKCGCYYLIRIRGKNSSGYGEWSDVIIGKTKTVELKWYQGKHGKKVTFLSPTRVKFGHRQSKVVVDYTIRSSQHKTFSWEFEMHKISDFSWIGFVRGPAKKHIDNWNYFLGGNPSNNEFSIGFGIGSTSLSVQNRNGFGWGYNNNNYNNNTINIYNYRRHGIKKGDKFKFLANFKDKTVELFINNHSIGVVFHNIPEKIVPAVSNNTSSSEISVRFLG